MRKSQKIINRQGVNTMHLLNRIPAFMRTKTKPDIGEKIVYLKVDWKIGGGFKTASNLLVCVDTFNTRMRLNYGWLPATEKNMNRIVRYYQRVVEQIKQERKNKKGGFL
jgi:hypothetical protein